MDEPRLIKKINITDFAIQKQKKILVIAIICVITLLISSSYALLTNFDKTDDVITFKTGNLNMTVNNTLVNLSGNLPESDENGLLNATPISLTLTNTGTMFIDGYEVMLVGDSSQTSTLNEKYIKYAISEDGTTYSTPSILTKNNNIIYTGYDLEVDASKTIYLKVWIDEAAGNYALNKTYYGSVEIKLYQKKEQPSYEMIKSIAKSKQTDTCKTYVEEDGITYISGTADCIDFNYVWYSGKLWRITAIYPDGTMKMITDSNITTIAYGSDYNFYTDEDNTSYVYQWLNEDFLDTLYNYENIIVTNETWNASPGNGTSTSKLPTTEAEGAILVNASVGLLNSYEYYKNYQNTVDGSGYLNIGYYWWLLNRYSTSSSNVYYVSNTGSSSSFNSPSSAHGVRPVVNLISTIQLSGGSGTASNPYRIKGDKEEAVANTTLINTRSSGEYVNFNEELYRIVEIENETTKLIKEDYVKDSTTILTKKFASTTSFGSSIETGTEEYWDYYLNNVWLKSVDSTYSETDDTSNILVEGTYYIENLTGINYKKTSCATVSNTTTIKECDKNGIATWSGYVGLPRYGEMFASQQGEGFSVSSKMWLITPYSTTITTIDVNNYYRYGYNYTNLDEPSSKSYAVRPTIHLKDTVVIKSGEGTKDKPFVVGLPS